jgi:HEAT repeat protein
VIKRKYQSLAGWVVYFLITIFSLASPFAYAGENKALDPTLSAILTYKFGESRKALSEVEDIVTSSYGNPEKRSHLEQQFVIILTSNATPECKEFVCRQFRIIGTKESVPALAVLLYDEKTADMARYALEPNPSPEAGKSLLAAVKKTNGKVRIGIINSLGEHRDPLSVKALGKLLLGEDDASAVASASALGKIGGDEAIRFLEKGRGKSPAVHLASSQALLEIADNLIGKNEKERALEIFKPLCSPEETFQVKKIALKGIEWCLGE